MADARSRLQLRADLLLVIAVATIGAVAVAADAPQPLRAIATIGMVLWAPGYALTCAFFAPRAVGAAERALLALFVSVAVVVLPAVALDAVGSWIDITSTTVTATACTWVAALVALRRFPGRVPRRHRPGLPIVPAAASVLVLVTLIGTLWLARATPEASGTEGSSALSATSRGPRTLEVEVSSAELRPMSYRLVLAAKAGPREVARFTLEPGATWRRQVDGRSSFGESRLFLYRGTEGRPFRRVHIPSYWTLPRPRVPAPPPPGAR